MTTGDCYRVEPIWSLGPQVPTVSIAFSRDARLSFYRNVLLFQFGNGYLPENSSKIKVKMYVFEYLFV